MIEELPLIIAAIAAFVAAGGLIFNGITTRQQSKSNHYRIFKEIEEEYNKIDPRSVEIRKFITMDFAKLEKQTDDIQRKVSQYRRDHGEFHEKIAYLALKGIIPKDIAKFYDLSFAHSLFYLEASKNKDELKKQVSNLVKWCEENNIQKISPIIPEKKK